MAETKRKFSHIFRNVAPLLSGRDLFAAYRNHRSGRVELRSIGNVTLDPEVLLNTFVDKLVSLCNFPPSPDEGSRDWVNLGSVALGKDQFFAAATYIGNDSKDDIMLIVAGTQSGPITPEEKERLSTVSSILRDRFDDVMLIRTLKMSLKALKRSTQQLAGTETLAALTDMTSGISHDFNNIIGGIIGRVQLMKLKTSEETLLADLNKIERLLLEGAQTVRSLQEFGTSTSYKKPRMLDLASLVTDYFGRSSLKWRTLAERKNVRVGVKEHIQEASVSGSPEDLTTVLDKLIENAVEHSFENGTVEVTLDETEKNFRLTVVDHGMGIEEEILGKVFYPFFTTKEARGAGLGLAIVHGIVGRHNGICRASSVPGSGAVFEVEIPKADGPREDSDITHTGGKVTNLRILVVDDDEQIREVLADMLAISGHQVTSCCDGFEALEKIKQAEYDLMITDLGMAGMSGLDLAGLVRKEKPDLPVALITGWGSQLNHDEVALAGIRAVLAKPFHLEDINKLVEKLVACPV